MANTEAPITEAAVPETPITIAPITEAPITEAPITEAPITELEPVDLVPEPVEEPPSLAPIQTPTQNSDEKPAKKKTSPSRREALEAAQRTEAGAADPFTIDEKSESHLFTDPFTVNGINDRLVKAINTPGVLIRLAIAAALLGVGAVCYDIADQYYNSDETLEFSDKTTMAGLYIGFSVAWIAGSTVLLYIASMLFRDMALGKRKVKKWSSAGFEESRSTFLLFAFAFIMAGTPLMGIWLLTGFSLAGPVRMIVAPLLLLGAWYNRSPFMILALDAFKNFGENASDWKIFYLYMFLFAIVFFIAGMIYWIPFPPLFFAAATFQSIMVLAFAVLSGWHIGRVVTSLEEMT